MRLSRRAVLKNSAAALGVAWLSARTPFANAESVVRRGRLKQSVSRWPYGKIALPEFARAVADMGLTAIDLLEEQDWSTLKGFGLTCSMGYAGAGSIPKGLKRIARTTTPSCKRSRPPSPRAAKAGVPNLITFFGNRNGLGDEPGIENCVIGLNRVKAVAESEGVTVCVELLNSKVNHKDYQGDSFLVRGRGHEARRVASSEVALRHLPHANHGGRRHSDDSRQPRVTSAISTRVESRPPRARRHSGAQLGRHLHCDPRHRFSWFVAHEFVADARSAPVATRGRRAV